MNKEILEPKDIIPFPECSIGCTAVEYFGVCECESICPWKFDKNGNPKPSKSIKYRKE